VHVLDWQDTQLSLPPLPAPIRGATLLSDGSRVPFRTAREGVTLTLPERGGDTIDLIVVLEMEP
jgi:hypothetical protein